MAHYKLTLMFFLIFLMSGLAHTDLPSACSSTLEPQFCMSTLTSFEESWEGGSRDLSRIALNVSMDETRKVIEFIFELGKGASNQNQLVALQDCEELLDITLDTLQNSMSKVTDSTSSSWNWRQSSDVQTWLSAAIANQVTCSEGFLETRGSQQTELPSSLHNVSRLLSNSLALVKNISVGGRHKKRHLLSHLRGKGEKLTDGFPFWLSSTDRRRLVEDGGLFGDDMVTVAGDGSGNHTTITEALNAAPNKSLGRYVIYIRKGVYQEYVEVPSWKTNIMMVGEGINVTVITGRRSVVDGWTTYHSATVGKLPHFWFG